MNAFFSRPVEEQNFNASPVDNEDLAKAAIVAMLEPTGDMLAAPDLSGHEASSLSIEYLKEIYRDMIKAALLDK